MSYAWHESQLDRDSPIFRGPLTTAQFLRLSSLFRLSLLKLTNIHPTPCLGSREEKQMRWEQQQQSSEGDLRHLGTSGDFPVLCLDNSASQVRWHELSWPMSNTSALHALSTFDNSCAKINLNSFKSIYKSLHLYVIILTQTETLKHPAKVQDFWALGLKFF